MCQVCKHCHINPVWIWRLTADELCEVIVVVVVVVVAVLHFAASLHLLKLSMRMLFVLL